MLAVSVNAGYDSLVKDGFGNLESFGFSVNALSGAFDLYADVTLGNMQKDVNELASEVEELEDELDLASGQNDVMLYIYGGYDDEYANMYDRLYV